MIYRATIAALLVTVASLAQTRSLALDLEPCQLDGGAALARVTATCGRLPVAQDPARPHGDRLELFVARVAALSANPRPDPLTLLTGGPGQSAIDFYTAFMPAFERIRRDRDILLVDQRGTGRSSPLDCPMDDTVDLDTADRVVLLRLIDQCLDSLDKDPRLFTTSVAVADLDQVRAALNIDSWNLYGISYGTRVAQHYLRRYPARARTVILDGVVPSDLALGPDIALHAQGALDQMFARCRADAPCQQAFGDLPANFDGLVRRLEKAPVSLELANPLTGEPETEEFSHMKLKAAVRLLSYATDTVALLPILIHRAHQGDYVPLSAQARMALTDLTEALNYGMHNAVVCTEDVPFYGAIDRVALGRTYLGPLQLDALETICERWPAGRIDVDFKEPLISDTPILILSGAADPVTPSVYGDRAQASGLNNSLHLIAPGHGHGIAVVGCTPRIMADFIASGSNENLAVECLSREGPAPFFLTLNGPAP